MTMELFGRARELALFDDMCAGLDEEGCALLIGGEPGSGKTALVAEFEHRARLREMEVLRATGSVVESSVPFAGLHMLIRPLTSGVAHLPPPQRTALEIAFGISDGPAPSAFLAGLAALSLLSRKALKAPLLVLAEDIHWFDVASRTALLVAARRARFESLAIVMTHRTGAGGVDAAASDIQQIRLAPLTFIDANALLDTRPDTPRGGERRNLLELAAGNPLALVELSPGVFRESGVVPVTRRLETAFAGRFVELDDHARRMLLALALTGEDRVDDAVVAVAQVLGEHPEHASRWVAMGIEAGLLRDSRRGVSFRHPLVRSAVVSATSPPEREEMLRALVDSVPKTDRSVWWRAELAVGHDAELAAELERLGVTVDATGDFTRAAVAFGQAAELSPDPRQRVDRRLLAAESAIRAGEGRLAADLLDDRMIRAGSPAAQEKARWLRELVPTETPTALARGDLAPALAAIEGMSRTGAADAALDALLHLASISWNHAAGSDRGSALADVVATIDLDRDDPRMLFLTTLTDPVHRATDVIARIHHRRGTEISAENAWYLGYALNVSGDIELSAKYLAQSIRGLRETGNVLLLPHALMARAWVCFLQGRFAQARDLIDECSGLAGDLADSQLQTAAAVATSWFDSLEGRVPVVESVDSAARDVLATRVLAQGMADLVAGRLVDAQRHFLRLADPSDPIYTPMFGIVSLPNLVEVTALTGDRHLASAHLDRVAQIAKTWQSPTVDAAVRFAQIVVQATDGDIDQAEQTLDSDPLPVPFFDARAHLYLGALLRHAPHRRRARRHLQYARTAFESFPAHAWAQRCRDELRASGLRALDSAAGAGQLTAQELRICRLASTGLSNRQIAEHLFLSPRTIGAHLYAAYRKLGISNRHELPTALADLTTESR